MNGTSNYYVRQSNPDSEKQYHNYFSQMGLRFPFLYMHICIYVYGGLIQVMKLERDHERGKGGLKKMRERLKMGNRGHRS